MATENSPLITNQNDTSIDINDTTNNDSLSKALHQLETFLTLFGFNQTSVLTLSLSWLSFIVLSIAVPILTLSFTRCTTESCYKYEINRFEYEILSFQCLVAAVSLLCVSHSLRKYGVRKFLFVDRCHGTVDQFRHAYVEKIRDFFTLLAKWIIPCLVLKIAREILRVMHMDHDSWWQPVAILVALIISWTYSTVIYFAGCALFNLVCSLQVIHFENYGKLLERDLDIMVYLDEHIRLTHYLSKISHRFRIFFILELLLVTASQFLALVQTTGNRGIINPINGGDFLVSSIVELVGVIICLHAAAKITHRAQGIASVATRWHSLMTCMSTENTMRITSSSGNLDALSNLITIVDSTLPISYSESDLEATDYVPVPNNNQVGSVNLSYQKRQAFVTYLLTNPGGFSVFGWRIERNLMNTIFFLELSLVFFVLGKTISLT